MLRDHIGKVLKRVGVEYEENEEIETGNTVKPKIRERLILFTIIVMIVAIASVAWWLKLHVF